MAAKRAPAVLLLPSFALGVQPPAMLSPLCRDGAGADSLLCPHPPEPNPMAELLLDPKALAVTLPAPAQSMAPRRGGSCRRKPCPKHTGTELGRTWFKKLHDSKTNVVECPTQPLQLPGHVRPQPAKGSLAAWGSGPMSVSQ